MNEDAVELNQFKRVPTESTDLQEEEEFPESDSMFKEDTKLDIVSTEDGSIETRYNDNDIEVYDDEQPIDRRYINRNPDGSFDLQSYCASGEWGKVTPLLDIGCTTIIKGPGCEPITPFILLIIVFLVWFALSFSMYSSEHSSSNLALIFLCIGGGGLAFSLFWTAFTNPGFILRKTDKKLTYRLQDVLYCNKCMVTFEEARKHTIVHCFDCDRCCKNYDHHCPVLGNCIG